MKKIAMLFGVLIAVMGMSSLVSAQVTTQSISAVAYGIKELKTIEFDYGYLQTCAKDTWCNQSFAFYPSDSVSEILSVLIRIVAEQPNNEGYSILVDDEECDVSFISNAMGKAQYVADFKCANLVTGEGNYTTSVMVGSDGIQNFHFRVYITYINDPLTCEIGSTQTFDTNETIVFTTFIRNNATVNLTIWDSNESLVYEEYYNSTGDPIIKTWATDVKGQYYARLECTDTRGNGFNNFGFTHFIIYPQTFEVIFNNTENITFLLEDLTELVIDEHNNTNFEINNVSNDVWYHPNKTVEPSQNWIGGTEYSPDEYTGKVVVRILDSQGDPVTGATCGLYVFYPNNSIYLNNSLMTEAVVGVGGIYYIDFNLSADGPGGEVIPGVYPYAVDCYKDPKDYFMLDSYHVFGANRTEQAREVWEYPTRELTYYEDVFNYTYLDEQFVKTWENQTLMYEFIYSMNQNMTLYFEYTWDNQTLIYEYLVTMNSSLSNQISDVSTQLSVVESELLAMWSDMNESFDDVYANQTELYDFMVAHNQSISDQLLDVSDDLYEITIDLQEISNNVSYNQQLLLGINTTLGDNLYTILADLDSIKVQIADHNSSILVELDEVDTLIVSHNATIFAELQDIIGDLENITTTLDNIDNDISSLSVQLDGVSMNLTELRGLVVQMDQDIRDELAFANSSIHSRFDSVDADFSNITTSIDTVNTNVLSLTLDLANHNNTMVSRFDSVDYKLDNINVTLIDSVVNVNIPEQLYTNITNESIQQMSEEIIIKMLEHARILNDRVINFHNDEYCISNTTLRHNITYEYCIGNNCRILSDIMDEDCQWDCDSERNLCNEPPWRRMGIIMGIVVVLILAFLLFGVPIFR